MFLLLPVLIGMCPGFFPGLDAGQVMSFLKENIYVFHGLWSFGSFRDVALLTWFGRCIDFMVRLFSFTNLPLSLCSLWNIWVFFRLQIPLLHSSC